MILQGFYFMLPVAEVCFTMKAGEEERISKLFHDNTLCFAKCVTLNTLREVRNNVRIKQDFLEVFQQELIMKQHRGSKPISHEMQN